MSRDETRADTIRRGRLGVIEALTLHGLPADRGVEAVASIAASQGVSADELLERIGRAHDPVAFFEAMVQA